MFQYGVLGEGLRIEHRHGDGSWAVMEREDPHDAADVDPEREWDRGHVYVCACGEEVRVTGSAGADAEEPAGAA